MNIEQYREQNNINLNIERETATMKDLNKAQANIDFHAGRNNDCGEAKACPKRLSVSAMILENHRMVDTADESLGLILATLIEKLDGRNGEASGLNNDDCSLPTSCIPLLQDMMSRQQSNAEVIERILDLVEGSL